MTKVSIVDFIAKKLKRCIAIVEDGDTASQAIAAGKYVIWKGNPCKASTAISSGDTLSSSNLTALSDGVGNEISASIPAVVNNLTSDSTTSALSAAQGKALNGNIAQRVYSKRLTIDSKNGFYIRPVSTTTNRQIFRIISAANKQFLVGHVGVTYDTNAVSSDLKSLANQSLQIMIDVSNRNIHIYLNNFQFWDAVVVESTEEFTLSLS